ncbi:preprotein translocase subunit SecE [bacterium]|nr:preprotein translocase subunit SecE [bacterium]
MMFKKKWSEFKAEMGRVSWPGKAMAMQATRGVLVVLVVVASFLGLADFLLNLMMKPLVS